MANFSFGSNTAGNKPTFGGLGNTTAPGTGGFSFGGTPAATAAAPTTGLFGTQTTNTQATGFGAAPANTSFGGFGKPATLGAPAPTLNFGVNTTQTSTTNPSTGFDFGKTTALGGGLSLSNPNATGLGMTGGGGLFGSSTMTSTTATLQPQQPAAVGLGGIDINASKPKAVEGKTENTKVKESQVPQEIVALVENLKTHIKQQKDISSEIAKTSTRKLFSVQNEIQNMNWMLSDISNLIDNNYVSLKMLKSDTSEAISNADMAQRTQETHANLQYENTAPLRYFMNLVQKYECELLKLRGQVEQTEKHMRSLTNPQKLSPDDLKRGMKQIHESFVSLASRVSEIHQKVEDQKEQYLNLRRHLLHDKTNVFEESEGKEIKTNLSRISSGPTPFSTMTGMNLGVAPNTTNKDSWFQNSTQVPGGFGMRTFGTDSNLLGANSTLGGAVGTTSALVGNDGGFNLQKPPLGTKRNRH